MKNILMLVKNRLLKLISVILIIILIVINMIIPTSYSVEETNNTTDENTWTGEENEEGIISSADFTYYVEIAGNDQEGYYLKFVDDIDEKLQEIIDADKNLYTSLGVDSVDTIKKFLKAEMATQFPDFGQPISSGGIANGSFRWPLDPNYPIDASDPTNLFGPRVHPIYGGIRNHTGIDIQAPNGSTCYAIGNGTVKQVGYNSGWGYTITLSLGTINGQEITCMYCHLTPESVSVVQGQTVTAGQPIAATGTTGQTQGGHLHFEVSLNGSQVDPLQYVSTDGSVTIKTDEQKQLEEEQKKEEDKEEEEESNEFQGSITLRRVTPNKEVGEYDDSLGNDNPTQTEETSTEGRGTKEDIPNDIAEMMRKASLPENATVKIEDLAYLKIPYINFDGQVETGTMIVNKTIADEVLNIFQDLYNLNYPIQNMQIIDAYYEEGEENNNLLDQAYLDNNTFSLYYGETGTHATGNAIDLNPYINPKVEGDQPKTETSTKYLNRTPENSWNDNEKDALITKESQVYKIFEKYGWTWGGDSENPDYMHFEKKTQSETSTISTGIDTRVYDLSYVPEETFNQMVANNDERALRVFTLDKDFQAIIATWSYSTDGGLKISKGKTLNYRKALNKYTMPYELLAGVLVDSNDVEFTKGLAQLAIDSEYVVAIEDKVSTTRTTVDTTYVTNQYYEGTDEPYNAGSVTTADTEIKISENASQKAEVTYVDCWYVKFNKDVSFSNESVQSGNINTRGKVTPSKRVSTENYTTYQEISWEAYSVTNVTRTTTVENIIYEYETGNEHIGGNAQKFIDLYNEEEHHAARRNLLVPWLSDILERYVATVNYIDIMKYLIYQAENVDFYGLAVIKFEDYKPEDFNSVVGNNASGNIVITGGDVQEKVWNALISAGYSEIATAAVMGNIEAESGFKPGQEEYSGRSEDMDYANGQILIIMEIGLIC